MNILKKSRVLNQNCLRDKVKELSPLLRNLDWPLSRDSVFRASWNYYASGCQERLSNTRRRIEQNARIMASDRRPKGPLPADLKLPFDESQLPPGADLDEQIYRELVSCFQNAEGHRSVRRTPSKRPKVYKSCDMGKFSTPEQWFSWKREEREVDEVLQKSKDPYVKEELSKKLQHLQQKLTERRPLVVLPKPKEDKLPENDKVSKKVKSRKKFKVEPKTSRQLSKETVFQGKTSDKLGSTYSKSKTNVSKLQLTKLAKKYKVPSDLRKTSKKIGENISKTYTNVPLGHQKSKRSSNLSELHRVSHISETLNRLIAKHPSLESVMSSKPMKLSSKSKHIEKTDEGTLRKEKLNINRDKYKRNLNQKKTKYSTENHKRNSLSLSQFSQNSDIKMWDENKKNKKIGRKEKLSEMPLSENNLTLPKTSDGDRISKEPIMKFVSTPKSSLVYPPKLEPYIHEILKATNPYDGSHLQFKEDQIANSDNKKDKGQEQINPNVQETLEETSVFGSVGRKSDKFGWQFKRHKIASSDNAKEKGRKKNSYIRKISEAKSVSEPLIFGTKRSKHDGFHRQLEKDQIASSDNAKDEGREEEIPNIQETLEGTSARTPSFLDSIMSKQDELHWQLRRDQNAKLYNDNKKSQESINQFIQQILKGKFLSDPSLSDKLRSNYDFFSWPFRKDQNAKTDDDKDKNQKVRKSDVSRDTHRGRPNTNLKNTVFVRPTGKNKITFLKKPLYEKVNKSNDIDSIVINTNDYRRDSEPNVLKQQEPDLTDSEPRTPLEQINRNDYRWESEFNFHKKLDPQFSDYDLRTSLEVKPLVISQHISNFMKEYGSVLSFYQLYPELFKSNELERSFIEAATEKEKPKATRKSRKPKAKKAKKVDGLPSKSCKNACSLCNCLKKKQSEMPAYMQRMQQQRQRLELKTYYTQKFLKLQREQNPDPQERKRVCTREVLVRCYETLHLCQEILEHRREQACDEGCQHG